MKNMKTLFESMKDFILMHWKTALAFLTGGYTLAEWADKLTPIFTILGGFGTVVFVVMAIREDKRKKKLFDARMKRFKK